MLPKNKIAPWLNSVTLVGYDDPQPDPATEGDPGPEEGEGDDNESLEKLQKALKAERLRSKNLERKLKAQPAPADEEADEEPEEEGEEPEKPKAKAPRSAAARAAEAKLQKLQAAFVQSSFAATVRDLATNFVDPSDAVAALDLSLITHEVDDDDPANIVWDESEIKAALKDLAKRKPHFLKPADGATPPKSSGRPSGSKFNGRQQPSTPDTKAQLTAFQQRFPAMRGVRGPQG